MACGRKFKVALQPRVTKAASFTGTAFASRRLASYTALVITLNIFSAERDSANETYDFYVWTKDRDGIASWDIVHFPQIATTGAKTFTARIMLDSATTALANVTTAVPGVAASDPANLQTDAAGAQRIKQLGAGILRHGPILEQINYDLVVAGTVATGIDYSISAQFE